MFHRFLSASTGMGWRELYDITSCLEGSSRVTQFTWVAPSEHKLRVFRTKVRNQAPNFAYKMSTRIRGICPHFLYKKNGRMIRETVCPTACFHPFLSVDYSIYRIYHSLTQHPTPFLPNLLITPQFVPLSLLLSVAFRSTHTLFGLLNVASISTLSLLLSVVHSSSLSPLSLFLYLSLSIYIT